ncbi:MAG TPA: hypothetical protein DCW49_09685, partial [Alteromonas australica]|nr:hypothetical protein [Alteromonas australica]
INGAFNVFQRSTSVTGITSENYYAADRFKINMSDAGTHTMSQSDTVPAGQGFNNSVKLDCTTADASVAAGSYMSIDHRIEAQDLQRLNWGTSSAKKLTMSFWVRSNLTGTFVLEFLHGETGVYNSNTYTIDSANTWEKKTITISGYTSTAINDDNGIGLYIFWWLHSGSTYGSGTTTNDTWHSTQANRAGSLSVDFGTSTDNEFYLTGVQLEVGEQATAFEHEDFGTTLRKCKRYFELLNMPVYPTAYTTAGLGNFFFTEEKRSGATLAMTTNTGSHSIFPAAGTTTSGGYIYKSSFSGDSVGGITADAEL